MIIPLRNMLVHDTGESFFPGEFELTDVALKNYNISRKLFGSTEIKLPNNTSFRVKDYQYTLPDGSIGMHFIPVNDHGNVKTKDNEIVSGYYLIDSFLRKEMGLKENEPIYALVNYFHPEENNGTLQELMSKSENKVEMGFTHLGAYYGQGYTTNAPMLYHSHKFGVNGVANQTVYGYPANIQILGLKGVSQVTLNKNLRYVDVCLNAAVMFPNRGAEAYKDSKFRPVNINTALMFYRDWIMFERYLRLDNSWYTYCAAHKTLVTTIAMNLPHNLTSFKEVYGDQQGTVLFEKFKLFYNSFIGPDPGFLPEDETYFEPLWKLQGFTSKEIHPFSLEEYNAYEKARLANKLKSFKGRQPLGHNDATSWACQSTAEIIAELVEVYADMLDAGQIMMSAFIIGFIDKVHERMGIGRLEFLFHAMPIVDKAMIAHAKIHASKDPSTYLKTTFQELFEVLGGKANALPDFEKELKKLKGLGGLEKIILSFIKSDPLPEVLAAWALLGVVTHWDVILAGGTIDSVVAYEEFYTDVQKDLQKAREMLITGPDKVQFYTPPGMVHLICNGIYESNPFVTVKEVCTIINYTESQIKNKP